MHTTHDMLRVLGDEGFEVWGVLGEGLAFRILEVQGLRVVVLGAMAAMGLGFGIRVGKIVT